MTVLELLSKNKNNPRASDDAMLLWLYDRWKSEEGQKLQHQLEKREIERDTPRAIFLYDYIGDCESIWKVINDEVVLTDLKLIFRS